MPIYAGGFNELRAADVKNSPQRLKSYAREILANSSFDVGELIGLLPDKYAQIDIKARDCVVFKTENTRDGKKFVRLYYDKTSWGQPYKLPLSFKDQIVTKNWRMDCAFVSNDPNESGGFDRNGFAINFSKRGVSSGKDKYVRGLQVDIVTGEDGETRLELAFRTDKETPLITVWDSRMSPETYEGPSDFTMLADTANNIAAIIRNSGIMDLTGPNYR